MRGENRDVVVSGSHEGSSDNRVVDVKAQIGIEFRAGPPGMIGSRDDILVSSGVNRGRFAGRDGGM